MERGRHRNSVAILAVAFALLEIGSAVAQSAPIIYPASGQSLDQQAQDEAACRTWAQQQTGMYPGQTVPEYYGNPYANQGAPVVSGAARGAAIGAVGGAIAGDAGKGAAMGAAMGGTAGLLRRNRERRAEANYNQQAQAQYQNDMGRYNQAFAACMQGRGYTVR